MSNEALDYAGAVTIQTVPIREPNRLEKRSQLARLISHRLFKRSPKLSELMQYLVESAIAGVEVDERMVGIHVYGRSEDWITLDDSCARDGLSRLRKMLETYYATDGIEDRLDLNVDKYHAVFSYNLRHPVERELRLAARSLGTDFSAVYKHLDEVFNIEPHHAEARAMWEENEIWRIFYGYDMGLPEFLDVRELQVTKALQDDPECWRAHVVKGALHCCRQEWADASKSFEEALRISLLETHSHPWYAGFLMAIGRIDEALHLMKARASEPSESPWPQLSYAIFLYAGRHNAEALQVLRDATVEEQHRRFFDVMTYFCLFAKEDFPTKYDRLHLGAMMELRPESEEFYYPIFSFVCLTFIPDPEDFQYELIKQTIKDIGRVKLAQWTRPERSDCPDDTRPCLSPFQLAIGYLAIGEIDWAIDLLEMDLAAGHPLMAWLHLWPVFDPLRDVPAFKALIRQMNLPKARKRQDGSRSAV